MHIYFAVLPILTSILCVCLGLFTLSRNLRHLANIGFAIGLANLTVIEAGDLLVILGHLKTGLPISVTGYAFLPVGWMLFSVVFARAQHDKILKRWAPAIVLMSLASLFFMYNVMAGNIFILPSYTENSTKTLLFGQNSPVPLGGAGKYLYAYVIFGMVLNVMHLESTFRSSSGMKRWQIKYIIFGVGAILSFLIYISSHILLVSAINLNSIPATSAVIFLSVAMMTLFIVRHRLLDVDIFVSRYVVYNSITVFIVGLYLLMVGISAQIISYFDLAISYFLVTFFVFASILVLVILLFSMALRRKIQLFITRHFYKHKYEFRDKWMDTTEKISSKRSIKEVIDTLIDMIRETMGSATIEVWLYDPISGMFRSSNDSGEEILINSPIVARIIAGMAPFAINERELLKYVSPKGDESFKPVLCAPLLSGPEIIGFILLGEDISGEPYRQDDFQLLTAVASQTAVQVKNIRLAQELMTAKEVEAFHRMSSFIMHDLKNLTNSLSLVSQNAKHHISNPEFQQDAVKTIDSTVARMKGLISKLSSLPKEPELKKENLSVKEVIEKASERAGISLKENISFNNSVNEGLLFNVDHDAMEMVFLNILKNACEEMKDKGKIEVEAASGNEAIEIRISDSGTGMSKEFIQGSLFHPFKTTKEGGFGIGLYQCKTIIEAHGGSIEVESEKGKRTTFSIRLPKG